MILKYIPYSAYQVKTVNCCQSIKAPLRARRLNILIIILTDTGTAGRYLIGAKYFFIFNLALMALPSTHLSLQKEFKLLKVLVRKG